MTFFKVNDPKNRNLIKEVIAKRSIIREADRRRKMGEAFEFEQLSRFFKPITKEAEKIEKGIKGLPVEIARVLPQPINIQQPQQRQPRRRRRRQQSPPSPPSPQPRTRPFNILSTEELSSPPTPPPTPQRRQSPQPIRRRKKQKKQQEEQKYPIRFLSPDKDKNDEENEENEENEGYYELNPNIKPSYIKKEDDGYKFGDYYIRFSEKGIDVNKEGFFENWTNSHRIQDILTNKDSKQTWNDLNDEEKKQLAYVTIKANVFPTTGRFGTKNQWDNVFSHIWFNKFFYMTDEEIRSDKNKAKYYLNKIEPKIEQKTKDKIKNALKQTAAGLKKNYVTLPSDPTELVDRLTLLSGSKDAGNTGVYNEMVSICDELLKRKIIGKGQYKQFLSNI